MNPTGANFLGSTASAAVPTDPSYYLNQVGLSSLVPSAYNADTLAAMFSPQGMQYTPANAQATNPFEAQFLQSAGEAMKLRRPSTAGRGLESLAPGGMPGQDQQGGNT